MAENLHQQATLPRANWLPAASRYLELESAHLTEVTQLVRRLLDRGLTSEPDPELLQQTTVLAAEQQAVLQAREFVLGALQKSSGCRSVRRISRFPWTSDERLEIESQCRRVRELAANLTGMARASQRTFALWSDVLGSLLQVLTGSAPHEGMYSASGGRVAVAPVQGYARA